ncbi:MAG: acetate kinase [Firmicutes bacterium]|nr:acetate kinase [Bacillota bacterium]
MDQNTVLARGVVERIGLTGSQLRYRAGGKNDLVDAKPVPGHREALEMILQTLISGGHGVIGNLKEIDAVGHRVVHGGEYFQQPVAVDNNVLELLEECSQLAPLHNPPNIMGIKVCRQLIPHAAQVAVFDTAFHQTIPDYAYMYAIPYKYYREHKIRKYGFHGTSHKYVSRRAAELADETVKKLKIITCHLGNGASLCAIDGDRSVDTTMGFTPLAGVIMGTRCGDVDPAIVDYMSGIEGITGAEVLEILNKHSGVLGLSGLSSDFRDLEQAALEGHPRARLALDMFIYSIAKNIGALIAALGGLDALVFTAGIGENSPGVRAGICSKLNYMGILLDDGKNSTSGEETLISTSDSLVQVFVIPTDEEKMIAEETKTAASNLTYK